MRNNIKNVMFHQRYKACLNAYTMLKFNITILSPYGPPNGPPSEKVLRPWKEVTQVLLGETRKHTVLTLAAEKCIESHCKYIVRYIAIS